jgi:hypothetical protein
MPDVVLIFITEKKTSSPRDGKRTTVLQSVATFAVLAASFNLLVVNATIHSD